MLSICIPTLNRPYYLYKAIYSIYTQKEHSLSFELCISNNNSDVDYSEVEKYIQDLSSKYGNINYVSQDSRLSIDEHMHYVINMSHGDYVYMLGDDDFFKNDAFIILSHLISDHVDFALVNSNWIDGQGRFISTAHREPIYLDNISKYEKYLYLYNKCTYGALLVKKSLFHDDDFIRLYTTSHAYCCFWISLLNNNEPKKIVFQNGKPVVNLRAAEKNYNLVNVIFNDVHLLFTKLIDSIEDEEGKYYINEAYKRYKKRNSSVRFLCGLQKKGVVISQINYSDDTNNSFYFKIKKLLSYTIFKLLTLSKVVNV
ncbi:glycosyltransferase family 2 protein [Vibrio mangrovi]|uniref:Abequosyltransferase RfbV n=1 Tax=Vibrio mangrovi TaxID=474394 RepID=A0A1Y6IZQ8_9VIBR|nr:glycosyltransferase [Vibrio mangrovi]MDW6002168.1 glycosyltransferase [Vibrio mangrovi]SMS01513.1 Abequosyltransferase RfbV [Vibrio mangrovi]